VSLGVRHGQGLLHSNFVVAVLSDLFGIQARSGCFCAGPYIHRAYPIDDAWSKHMHAEAVRGRLGARLAFTRLSFPYYTSDESLAYVLAAVHLLAGEGWKLLPDYRFDPETGLWEHRARVACDDRLAAMLDAPPPPFDHAPESVLAGQFEAAKEIVRTAGERRDTSLVGLRRRGERSVPHRWFALPDACTPATNGSGAPRGR